jgi:hypothetical protein
MPEPPSCANSVSDEFISAITLDMAFAPGLLNAYMVKNQLMTREDYDNLRAETNGIFVEGYEVAVNLASTNETIGGSQNSIQEYFINPQSEDILFAFTIPSDVSALLADELDCLPFSAANYPEAGMFETNMRTDVRGNAVPRSLGMVYSKIHFFGHTQGSVDVRTQNFTFPVNLCCGCTINWNNCDAACSRYCDDAEATKSCQLGVTDGADGYDCRYAYHNLGASWPCVDEEGNPGDCTCDDC